MGNRSLKKYLYDVQQSIVSIYEYLGNKRDFFEYESNKQLRRAVERELEIIGEAVNKCKNLPFIRRRWAAKKLLQNESFAAVFSSYSITPSVMVQNWPSSFNVRGTSA